MTNLHWVSRFKSGRTSPGRIYHRAKRPDTVLPLHYALYDTLLNYHSSILKLLIVHNCGQLSFDVCCVSTEAF